MASNALRFLDQTLDQYQIPWTTGADVLDKQSGQRQYVAYMLDRTNSMFEYTNLPPTIPSYMLELYLQIFGYASFINITESDLKSTTTSPAGLYIFFGGIGGERDLYYRPTLFIASNPQLKNSINADIIWSSPTDVVVSSTRPCVLMKNDSNMNGLLPLFNRYATQLVENDISIHSAQINARAQIGICVNTDSERDAAQKYLDGLEAGKLGILGKSAFLEGITVSNVSVQSANLIIQLIELQQYLKASWFNDLGLNANFNMKREYLSEQEIATTTDVLLPLVDDMLECRKRAVDLINEIFGTNITVSKSSAWANKEQEVMNSLMEGGNMDAEEQETVTNDQLLEPDGNAPDSGPSLNGGPEPDPIDNGPGDETLLPEEESTLQTAFDELIEAIGDLTDSIREEDESSDNETDDTEEPKPSET